MDKIIICFLVAAALSSAWAYAGPLEDVQAAVMDKNYEQARELSTKLLHDHLEPAQRPEVEYYLGLSQLRLGQYNRARKAFEIVMHASVMQELYDKAAIGLVESYTLSGFYKDALRECENLLRKSPDSEFKSTIYYKLARTELKLMQWEKAKEYLQKIIDQFPQSFEAPLAKRLLQEKEYFAVQVGSFLDKDKALQLADELKAKNQYAYIVETASSDGATFYRVRVGQMTSLNDAQALESRLSKLGYPTLIYP